MVTLQELKRETKRFLDIIRRHRMMYYEFNIRDIVVDDSQGDYNMALGGNPFDQSNSFIIKVGSWLMSTCNLKNIMVAMAHELGHALTGNIWFVDKYQITSWDADEIDPHDLYLRRGAEFQADILATKILSLAGYTPDLVVNFQRVVTKKMGESVEDYDDATDDHPSAFRRIRAVRKFVDKKY